MRYIVSLPLTNADGTPKELFSDDPALIARFIEAEDRPGRGVYECINPLVPGARKRCLETVASLARLYFDLDLQHIEESPEDIICRLCQLPFQFTSVRDSGSSNLHLVVDIKDPPPPGTPEYDRVGKVVWKSLAEKLAADPAPAHPAALIRCVGTHNRKNSGNGLCHELTDGLLRGSGKPVDITELEALDELLARPLLTRKDKPAINGHDTAGDGRKAPVDIDARLAAMRWHGPGDSAINITQRDVMASQLRRGVSLTEAAGIVLAATKRCVAGHPDAASINWRKQELDVLWSGARLINKEPELVDRLPEEMYTKFRDLKHASKRPVVCKNIYGLYVRPSIYEAASNDAQLEASQSQAEADADAGAGEKEPPKKGRALFVIRPFEPFDPAMLPPRQWLYGRHYLRKTVSATVAPGGYGKSTLDMIEGIAMATARNLLGEQPGERLRIWFHNGEEPYDEMKRRVAAICQHYSIPQEELVGWFFMTSGNEFPLRVAEGYTKLEINDKLIGQIKGQIEKHKFDGIILDPLITLHGVPETDNTRMDGVIRIFASIADEHDCAIELSHHVRKGASGSNGDYGAADIRGATAIHDAIRAARMLNHMSDQDAKDLAIEPHHRAQYFRVDKAKGNYSPAAKAVWRQFINVEIANGDDVGVIIAWDYPGHGEPTPQRQEQDRKADFVFLQLLDRFEAEGRTVSDRGGPNFAPAKFAKESEAKLAGLGNIVLAQAMRRLFQDKKIKAVDEGSGGKTKHKIARA